eukprot:15194-Heterococcus_DN1.PRE.1
MSLSSSPSRSRALCDATAVVPSNQSAAHSRAAYTHDRAVEQWFLQCILAGVYLTAPTDSIARLAYGNNMYITDRAVK